ncbi:twitching motility protein PilT [Bacteroidia bacterium]|nr:twitching motility protein PilT [Bacteroidia bacterium]
MKYLLDTSTCVFFFRDKFNIAAILKDKGIDNCCISEITLAELRYGAENSQNPLKHHGLIDEFIKRIAVIPITDSIRVFAEEKVRLRRNGNLVDDFDLLIASSALLHRMVLVTDNVKHFARINSIQIENWIERE